MHEYNKKIYAIRSWKSIKNTSKIKSSKAVFTIEYTLNTDTHPIQLVFFVCHLVYLSQVDNPENHMIYLEPPKRGSPRIEVTHLKTIGN